MTWKRLCGRSPGPRVRWGSRWSDLAPLVGLSFAHSTVETASSSTVEAPIHRSRSAAPAARGAGYAGFGDAPTDNATYLAGCGPDHERLTDAIGIGVLTRLFNRDLVDEAIAAADRQEKRVRLLPARVVVHYVLALCLFESTGAAGCGAAAVVVRPGRRADGETIHAGCVVAWPSDHGSV
ncbi:transposase domain-containing protein [Amycolatopsis magusensis]|uniref:transposase domain-containing protein n=1 Tax=Amycolatopsis magusensis TaxID=882444 RepID=UPI0037B5C9CC